MKAWFSLFTKVTSNDAIDQLTEKQRGVVNKTFFEELCLKDLKWEDNRTFSFAGRVGKLIGVAPEDVYLITNLYELVCKNEVRHER